VAVPDSVSISQLRETFIDFCDELNVDASFETARD
jgi:glycine cleavage system regulatory protein